MKKIISVLLVMVLALGVFAGCGAKPELEGTTTEILDAINADEAVAEFVNRFETVAIPAENTQSYSGLNAEFYAENIAEGSYSEPMMGSRAHSMVMLKVKDGVDAVEVANMVFENIDTRKWICVTAEHLYVNTSGIMYL